VSEFTGERVIPGQVNDELWAEHVARYAFAARMASGRRVLDLGCGYHPTSMYLADIYTVTGDLAGVPCMSVPAGNTPDGLPVGLQVIANHFNETAMFRVADAFQKVSTT